MRSMVVAAAAGGLTDGGFGAKGAGEPWCAMLFLETGSGMIGQLRSPKGEGGAGVLWPAVASGHACAFEPRLGGVCSLCCLC